MGSIKGKIFVLILITVFSFCLVTEVMANCDLYQDQATCPVSTCEWCQMPSSNKAHCFKKLESNWPISPAGTRLYRCSSLTDLVKYFYEWGLAIGGVLAFVSLIFGGVLYLSSAGKPEGVKEARDRISSAILGLILLFGCWLILNTINPDLTTFSSEPVNLSLIPSYECDTDLDCQKVYGINIECIESVKGAVKGDGNPQGMCFQKKAVEDVYFPHAVVFDSVNFNGTSHDLRDDPNNVENTLPRGSGSFAGSVITYFKNHELHFCDIEGCAMWNNQTDCGKHSNCMWDIASGKCLANCTESCLGPASATKEIYANCSLCTKDDCTTRFNKDKSCHWDSGSNPFCYTICPDKTACGYVLQLFGEKEQIATINAYDNNIWRWVNNSSDIQKVRLIKPGYYEEKK